VVGAPDPVRQEIVMAFVVVKPGVAADAALTRDLQELVRSELSPYKYPRRIEFLEALPRDPMGKVQTRILKERAGRAGGTTHSGHWRPPSLTGGESG
jgi:2-aminobenzoate-CoA ligase